MNNTNRNLLNHMILKQEKIDKSINEMSTALRDMNLNNKKLKDDILKMKNSGIPNNDSCEIFGKDGKKITVNDEVIILTRGLTVKKNTTGTFKKMIGLFASVEVTQIQGNTPRLVQRLPKNLIRK